MCWSEGPRKKREKNKACTGIYACAAYGSGPVRDMRTDRCSFTRAVFHGVNGMREAKNTMETDEHTKNEEKIPRCACSTLCLTLEVLVRKSSIMFDVCCLM